jgi:hypothetical protein
MTVLRGAAIAVLAAVVVGCGSDPGRPAPASPVPRQNSLWLGEDGIALDSALALERRGVDQLVVRRGSVSFSGGVPVLRLVDPPAIAGPLPVAVALILGRGVDAVEPSSADVLWRGLANELGGPPPAELVLDLATVPTGMDGLIRRLSEVSGVPVSVLLELDQVGDPLARAAAAAAHSCIVLTHGAVGLIRPGAETSALPLESVLEPLAVDGARVRGGIVLQPRCDPPVTGWGEDLEAISGERVAEISTSSSLDRTFIFRQAVRWSGRDFAAGDRVAVGWLDASLLNRALGEYGRLVLPDVRGWDLMGYPPATAALGLNREAFLRYLGGEGPAPQVAVRVQRSGRSVRVRLSNASPFASAVSSYGNWVEVALEAGALAASDRGDFDRVLLGSRRGAEWQKVSGSTADAVRFFDNYLAADEDLSTGVVTLPSSRARYTVRWHVVLASGEELTGTTRGS